MISSILLLWRSFLHKILFLSKILFIIIGIYYIMNYNIYSVTMNVPAVLRAFSIIDIPLKFIETIGAGLVILPVTIIILNLFYIENKVLSIMAAFCTIGGGLFSLMHLASKGLLEDYFRAGIFTIYNALSLEAKQKLFSDFFNHKINIYKSNIADIIEFKNYAQNYIDANWLSYTDTLKTIAINDVNLFASKCAENIYILYTQSKLVALDTISIVSTKQDKSWWSTIPWKGVIFATVCVVVGGYVVYKLWQGSTLLYELSDSVKEGTKRQAEGITQNIETDKILTITNENIGSLTNSVDIVKQGLETVTASHNTLANVVDNNAIHFKEALSHLRNLFESIRGLLPDHPNLPNINWLDRLNQGRQDITELAVMVKDTNYTTESLLLKITEIFKELAILKSELDNISSIEEVATPLLDAALERKMDTALAKINDFDPDQIVKDIHKEMVKRMENFNKEMEYTMTEMKGVAQTSKATLSKVEKIQSTNAEKLNEVKEALGEQVINNTKTTDAVKLLEDKQQFISSQLTSLRQDFEAFQTYVRNAGVQYTDMINDLRNRIRTGSSQMVIPSVLHTMIRINADNRSIGAPRIPVINPLTNYIFNPLRGLRNYVSSNNNNNNNS